MSVNIYLNFDGNCKEALEFYANVFNTEKPKIMTFGDAPQNADHPLPEEYKDLIMHSYLNINGSRIMFSDVFPGTPFSVGSNITLIILSNNIEYLNEWFNKLKDGGRVDMELQETFWSKCYGFVTDKFGISWQFNYEE